MEFKTGSHDGWLSVGGRREQAVFLWRVILVLMVWGLFLEQGWNSSCSGGSCSPGAVELLERWEAAANLYSLPLVSLRWSKTRHSKEFITTEVRGTGLYPLSPAVLAILRTHTMAWVLRRAVICCRSQYILETAGWHTVSWRREKPGLSWLLNRVYMSLFDVERCRGARGSAIQHNKSTIPTVGYGMDCTFHVWHRQYGP